MTLCATPCPYAAKPFGCYYEPAAGSETAGSETAGSAPGSLVFNTVGTQSSTVRTSLSICEEPCGDCPAGTSSTDGGPCLVCSGNTFSPAGSSACFPCPGNSIAVMDHSRCTCQLGSYNMSYGLILCVEQSWDSEAFAAAGYDQMRADFGASAECTVCPACLDCSEVRHRADTAFPLAPAAILSKD